MLAADRSESMFRKFLKTTLASLLLTAIIHAQGIAGLNWAHTWGGSGSDVGDSVVTDASGNIYVVGSTTSFGAGGQDVLLLKYDQAGNLLWTKTWGGPSAENPTALAIGPDGGIYVTGGTDSFGAGWYDVFFLKFDPTGNLLWSKTWGGSSFDFGHDIAFDTLGNVLVAAESYSYVPSGDSAAVVLKFTPNGDLLWSRVWASGLPVVTGPVYDGGYSLDVDGNGNILLSGITWDYNSTVLHNSIFVVKLDSAGNLLWNRNWAGPGDDEAWGTKTVRADSAGNVYVAGRLAPQPCPSDDFSMCDFDVLLVKLDENGNLVWSRTWKAGTGYDSANSLILDSSGNLVIAGAKDEYGSSAAALLIRYDPSGNLLSSNTWNGAPGSTGLGIAPSLPSNVIVTGSALNNVGSLQNAAGTSGTENGTLSTQASNLAWPVVALGAPSGTLTSPNGGIDTGLGGSDVLTASISFAPGATVIPGYPGYEVPSPSSGSPQNNTASGYASEPVNTGTGNYYYQQTDTSIAGRGFPLVFQRSYNAQDTYSGPLGANWNHTYNVMLTQTATGVANIRFGDGHGETYTLTSGIYVPQPGVYNALIASTDDTFTLTQKNQMQYHFSSNGRLAFIEDKNGNAVQLSYDGSGNLVTVTASGDRALSLAYDTNGRITTVTDPMGRTETYSYDGSNNVATATDPLGGVTTYAYDTNHHVTQIKLPNGNTLLHNVYDAQGRVVSQTNGRGFIWQFAYNTPTTGQTTITDSLGNATIHTYDSSPRIIGITDAIGHTTSYTYDANNNRTSIMNQNGNITTFAFDAKGNLTGLADPLSNVTAFTYDAENDLLTVTNPKEKTTNFSYDPHGNLASIQDALGNKTILAYDSNGELISKTDARGNATKFQYSSLGDLSSVTDAVGNATNLSYDRDGRLVSLTDPSLHTATSAYDALGRLTQVSDALGNKTKFSYDAVGNLLSVTDANGHATGYSYDATNNLVSVSDALGHVTKYAYDANNNRIGFTNAKGNSTSYQFDALNRLTRSVDPLGFTTAYGYDAVGNVATVTDAKGQTNKFEYDALNHLLSIAYADQKDVAYAYDADGNRTSMIDWTGTTSYSYDALDRLTSVAFPGNKTVAYSYDANGRRATLKYPGGQSVSFSYDANERLATVVDWLSHTTLYTYDLSGNLTRVQYPNSARADFTYDPANRLTSVINTTVGVPPLAFNYALDPVGNRTKVTEAGIPAVYGYDALNRLTSAQVWPLNTSWTYDAVGNRLSQVSPFGTTKYSYDASDRLLTAGTRTLTYDADGNENSVTDTFAHIKRTYAFNAANRLVSVDGGLANSFVYDGDGNRVSQSTGGLKQNYVNDVATGLPVVLQDSIGGGSTSSYVYGLNLIEAFQPLSNDFYHYDGLGSTILLTDNKGRPETAYLYDAWGNSILPALPTNPFRFTGQALDNATGFYYFRARYYDPTQGRFLNKDPLQPFLTTPISSNQFQYAVGNPLRFRDPSGLSSVPIIGFLEDTIQSLGAVSNRLNASTQDASTMNSCFSDIEHCTNPGQVESQFNYSVVSLGGELLKQGSDFILQTTLGAGAGIVLEIRDLPEQILGAFFAPIPVAHASSVPAVSNNQGQNAASGK